MRIPVALPGILVAILLAGAPAGSVPPAGVSPLAKGWGRLLASGTIMGVDRAGGTVMFEMASPARLELFEGGTAWRRQDLTGAQLVRLLPSTLVVDTGDARVPLAAIRAGTPAELWAVMRPDATLVSLKLWMHPPPARPAAARSVGAPADGTSGVILNRRGPVLDVLTSRGGRRSVLVTRATVIRTAGRVTPAAEIATHDVVWVDGVTNSDGSIAATRIDIALAVAEAARITGLVEQSITEVEGLVVGGVMITTASDTYYVRGERLGAFIELTPGRSVTAYGTPISAGTVPVGLQAREVVLP